MTPQPELQISGNFLEHPFAELLAEISAARLTGSLRVESNGRKCVFYTKVGRLVFAASNARSAKLFDLLLRRKKLASEDLSRIPNFQNDFELAAYLQEHDHLAKTDCDRMFTEQIEGIVVDALSWNDGDWTFTSLARVRDGLDFTVNVGQLLADYGRCLPTERMLKRFRSFDEGFRRSETEEYAIGLRPEEAFVLSRSADGELTASDLVNVAGMSQDSAFQIIYSLWLGGLLRRKDWHSAFSPEIISGMRGAKLELKKEAKVAAVQAPSLKETQPATVYAPVPETVPPGETISIEEYLAQVEGAETHYDVLGVDADIDTAGLKAAYFSLARVFHPDRFHAEGGEVFRRVQNAFSRLAQAHEVLKDQVNREMYDYRMRKEIAIREKRRAAGNPGKSDLQTEQAAENFQRGFGLLMDGQAEASQPFLARAAHFAPKNARYRAYYGKALSNDAMQRYKAEAEMQAALRIDGNNATFRLLLAEFYVQFNLPKRAEGELRRLLALFPSNAEAQSLLASLKR